MVRALRHRGPDGDGIWRRAGAGLAHTRLAVLDLSQNAHQPMLDDTGRFVIAFNGEIFNFRELRQELRSLGESFRSDGDTEVLLLGFRRWGLDLLPRLNGMFAFAIFDLARDELILARDRFGEKPLYFARRGELIVFGSEIKAILTHPELSPQPDLTAIGDYLALQYVPGERTAFAGIERLAPGTVMRARRGAAPAIRRFWTAPLRPRSSPRRFEDMRVELRERLETAVRRRSIADVPVGAFLSGGVDSSTVVALMSTIGGEPVRTFSMGFEEADHDERAAARAVAARFGADHTEQVVRPDVANLVETIAWHYGEPFADPSALPTYCLSNLARSQVTVALSGDGGDELFFGYRRYDDMAALAWTDRIPAPARRLARGLAATIPGAWDRRRPFGRVRRWLNMAGDRRADRYEPAIAAFFMHDKLQGLGEALEPMRRRRTMDMFDRYFDENGSLVGGAAAADLAIYLPDDILTKVDVASMAVGLETRSPLLDNDLADFALSVPMSVHRKGGRSKALLKAAVDDLLPSEILDRPKMGFGVPLDRWLRTELRDFMSDLLLSPRFLARGFVRPDYVRRIVAEHLAGQRLHHTRLWTLIMLEAWCRTWIDGRADIPAPARPREVKRVQAGGVWA